MGTHNELIYSKTFNEKFIKLLIYCYSYGFRSFGSTVDRKRVRSILHDTMRWEKGGGRTLYFCQFSEAVGENPFNTCYRFCNHNYVKSPVFFLHAMSVLDCGRSIRSYRFVPAESVMKNAEKAGFSGSKLMSISSLLYSNLAHGTETVSSLKEKLFAEKLSPYFGDFDFNRLFDTRGEKIRTSQLADAYLPVRDPACEPENRNKTPNNMLEDIALTGIIKCSRASGAKANSGNRLWSFAAPSLAEIIADCRRENDDFAEHLFTALDFFSRFFPLGEIGMFIRDRFGSSDCADSPFRFRHEYYMQALNDFHLIDLLYAIEGEKWCTVSHVHGFSGAKSEIFCCPLEIRVSCLDGREYLMFYDPIQHRCSSLRLEFITGIRCHDRKKVTDALISLGFAENAAQIEHETENARRRCGLAWGISAASAAENSRRSRTLGKAVPEQVSLRVLCNTKNGGHTARRLLRERRTGTVFDKGGAGVKTFEVSAADHTELRPFVRSYYSSIVSCGGMDDGGFTIRSDTAKMQSALDLKRVVPAAEKKPGGRSLPAGFSDAVGKGIAPRQSELLFNRHFSVYYHIIADAFVTVCSRESVDDKELSEIIKASAAKYRGREGTFSEGLVIEECEKVLREGDFLTRKPTGRDNPEPPKYVPKYRCSPDIVFYRDVVPLSEIELRWLKNVAAHPKARLFLTERELAALKSSLNGRAGNIQPFPFDRVKCFDRYILPERSADKEYELIPPLTEAIRSGRTMNISYITRKGETINGEFEPVVLEYSKRFGSFRGWFRDCADGRLMRFAVERIEKAEPNGVSCGRGEALEALHQMTAKNEGMVEFEVSNQNNIAEKLLTEFSPYKKECFFDRETRIYRIRLFYGRDEEEYIAVRLMSYGEGLIFVNRTHAVYREMQRRLRLQRELLNLREG